jgi:hypothetical protein
VPRNLLEPQPESPWKQKCQKRALGSKHFQLHFSHRAESNVSDRQRWQIPPPKVVWCDYVCARKMRPWQRKNAARGSILWSFVRPRSASERDKFKNRRRRGFYHHEVCFNQQQLPRCTCRLCLYVFIRRINKLHKNAPTHSLERERKLKHLKIRRITQRRHHVIGAAWVSMSERLNSMSRGEKLLYVCNIQTHTSPAAWRH